MLKIKFKHLTNTSKNNFTIIEKRESQIPSFILLFLKILIIFINHNE